MGFISLASVNNELIARVALSMLQNQIRENT